jgi:hypothetical protein
MLGETTADNLQLADIGTQFSAVAKNNFRRVFYLAAKRHFSLRARRIFPFAARVTET